jgi:hypothetical protein
VVGGIYSLEAAVDGRTGQSGALPRHPTVRVWSEVDHWSFHYYRKPLYRRSVSLYTDGSRNRLWCTDCDVKQHHRRSIKNRL